MCFNFMFQGCTAWFIAGFITIIIITTTIIIITTLMI